MNSEENACILIFNLMLIVIIIRINPFRMRPDTMHYGISKLLISECENERSCAVVLH